MEMIDILNKLREYEKAGHGVADAIKSTEMTQPVVKQEGGMSDIHIGAQDVLDSYTNEDGDLKMPKADVMKAMANEKAKAAFPRSYEIETAMKMADEHYNDDGSQKIPHEVDTAMNMDSEQPTDQPVEEDDMQGLTISDLEAQLGKINDEITFLQIDQKDKESALAALGELRSVLDKYQSQQESEAKPDFLDMDKDGNKTEPMKQAIKDKEMKKETVKEAIQMSADTPEEASVLMQILKLAGVQPVTPAMIGAEQPAQDAPAEETYANEPHEKTQSVDDLVNTHSGGLNRQKIQIKKGYSGDNELAAEDLAGSLRAQYESFKESYQAEAKKAKSPYAIGMAQAMKSTGDKPPLEKSTIKKAHDIAKSVEKSQK